MKDEEGVKCQDWSLAACDAATWASSFQSFERPQISGSGFPRWFVLGLLYPKD